MSEPVTNTQQTTPSSQPTIQRTQPSDQITAPALTVSQIISFCAAGIIGSFFLPWLSTLLGNISGFDFQKLNGNTKILWLIPIAAAGTIAMGMTGRSQKFFGQIAGALPFFALGYVLYHDGKDAINAIAIGGWLTLGLGLVMFLLARRQK